jgi:hypothetical protein
MLAHMDGHGRVDPRAALIKREAGIQYVLVAAIIPVALIPAIITLVHRLNKTGQKARFTFWRAGNSAASKGTNTNRARL